MVRRPIQYLEKRGIRQRNILEPTSSGTHAEVQELKERFYSGEVLLSSFFLTPPSVDKKCQGRCDTPRNRSSCGG